MCFRYLPHTSFDLHALTTPPAFVLSQDQTLHFVSSAPPRRTGTALPTKKGSYTRLLRSEDMLRRRAGQTPTLLHTDCLDRLQTAVMPQAPFATALAASHPHNRLHCSLVKEQFGDDKLSSPRCQIAFDTERTATHNIRQFPPVQRLEQLFFRNFHRGEPDRCADADRASGRGPETPARNRKTLISLPHNRLCSRKCDSSTQHLVSMYPPARGRSSLERPRTPGHGCLLVQLENCAGLAYYAARVKGRGLVS